MNISESNINDLIIRYLSGELSLGDQDLLLEWVNQASENRILFDEIVLTWQFSGTMSYTSGTESQQAFAALKKRMEESAPESSPKRNIGFRTLGLRLLKYAAIVVPVFLLGGLATYFILNSTNTETLNPLTYQVVTPNGTRSEITLTDGTKVWLNAGSSISYTENYNVRKREVNLLGEAFFTVAKDKTRPFVVKSQGMEIKALGTSFNVKAYPADNLLTATLVEGSIQVEGMGVAGLFSYTLQPRQNITLVTTANASKKQGELQRVTPGTIEKLETRKVKKVELENDVNTVLYTSWKDRRWVIEHENFHNFAEMLERRYNVNISYDAEEMKDISFTGAIENETLEQVIHILQLSAPLKYTFGKGEVNISLDKSQMPRFKKVMD